MEAVHGVANSHGSSLAKAGDPVTPVMLWSRVGRLRGRWRRCV